MGAPLRQVMLHSFVHAANMDSQTYQVPGYGVLKGSVKTGGGGGMPRWVAKMTERSVYIKILKQVQLTGDERQRGDEW